MVLGGGAGNGTPRQTEHRNARRTDRADPTDDTRGVV